MSSVSKVTVCVIGQFRDALDDFLKRHGWSVGRHFQLLIGQLLITLRFSRAILLSYHSHARPLLFELQITNFATERCFFRELFSYCQCFYNYITGTLFLTSKDTYSVAQGISTFLGHFCSHNTATGHLVWTGRSGVRRLVRSTRRVPFHE